MIGRLAITFFVAMCLLQSAVKIKQYGSPELCFKTYRLAKGRVLTPQGSTEDPTVNAIMKDAVGAQMKQLRIAEADKNADFEVRFMGGNTAGLQVNDPTVGDIAMWEIGGSQPISGRTFKKSVLVTVVVDSKSNRTMWTAKCTDKFGGPARMKERIEKPVKEAFTKFPRHLHAARRFGRAVRH